MIFYRNQHYLCLPYALLGRGQTVQLKTCNQENFHYAMILLIRLLHEKLAFTQTIKSQQQLFCATQQSSTANVIDTVLSSPCLCKLLVDDEYKIL